MGKTERMLIYTYNHSVAEQRVTGFFFWLLAGERMGTETRISLAASFMSGGGS
jgi:hypothetical protein